MAERKLRRRVRYAVTTYAIGDAVKPAASVAIEGWTLFSLYVDFRIIKQIYSDVQFRALIIDGVSRHGNR